MRSLRWLQFALAAALALVACANVVDSVDARDAAPRTLLQQLIANHTHQSASSHHPRIDDSAPDAATLLLSPPTAVTSLPFVQALSREQQSELLLQIGRLYLFGDATLVLPNITAATQWLHTSADGFGHPTAQFFLGALAAAATRDGAPSAESVLNYHFSALGGSIASSMALGYRYLHGYGVPQSCETALRHYKAAADRVVSAQTAARPIQVFSAPAPFRLSDHSGKTHAPSHADEDAQRLEYVQQQARGSSDPRVLERAASVVLFSDLPHTSAPITSERARSAEARALLERAAQLGSFSAKALLGHVYAYGLGGARQDVHEAARLYREVLNESVVANATSAEAANGLGLLYVRGSVDDSGVDYERAMQLFTLSARTGHADGVYNAGVLMTKAYPARAHEYLEASARVGHLKAQFTLARLHEKQRFAVDQAAGRQGASCRDIVQRYKAVAEHAADGVELLAKAASAFAFANDWSHALTLYRVAAEMGYEVAESNVAWLLERQAVQSPWPWQQRQSDTNTSALYRRIVHRGVAQDSADAHVRHGDLLYANRDFALALYQYELADDVSRGAHARALFSIGYMHEHGLGVRTRSLARARTYYTLGGRAEPVLRSVVWLLELKLRVQAQLEALVEFVTGVYSSIVHGSTDHDASESQSSRQQQQVVAAVPATGVTFTSALRFTQSTKLIVAAPALPRSFTIELWLRIDARTPATRMVVLDMQETYQLTLVRSDSTPGDHWVLHYRSQSTAFVFEDAPLVAGAWHHIAVCVSAGPSALDSDATPTLSLFVNGVERQALAYHRQSALQQTHHDAPETQDTTSTQTHVLAVGQSLTRSMSPSSPSSKSMMNFVGSLLHVRVWREHKSPDAIRRLAQTLQSDVVHHDASGSKDLAVEIHLDIQRRTTRDSLEHSSALVQSKTRVLTSVDVTPEMVQFPPKALASTAKRTDRSDASE